MIASSAQAQQIGDVFYIALENHNFTQPSTVPAGTSPQQLLGNTAAPYLNSLMTPGNPNAADVSYAGNYQNVPPGLHPSEPNYVYQDRRAHGPLNDNDPYPNNIVNAPNLSAAPAANAATLGVRTRRTSTCPQQRIGQSARRQQPHQHRRAEEPMDRADELVLWHVRRLHQSLQWHHQYNYAVKHNPLPFFTATNGGTATAPNTSPSNPQSQYYAPLQQLQTDLNNNTVADFNWITPDQYNDMHSSLNTYFTYNGVTYAANTDQEAVALGDNFLSIVVPEIEASQAFKDNGVIVIWNDETEGDETVGSTAGFDGTEIVISPLAKGNAYTNDVLYTHASDLVTLQNIFGVAGPGGTDGFLGNSAGANSLADLFQAGAIPAPIPEPSTWVMMGLGFAGLAGAAAYRRKQGGTSKPAVAG